MTFSIRSVARAAAVLALSLSACVSRADDTDRIRRQLDRLNKEIAESRAFPGESEMTLNELRQDLFQTALTTRDAKKRSDLAEQAIEKGQNATMELELLRADITAAGNLLRDLRDNIDALDRIVKNNQALVEEQSGSMVKLEHALLMRPEALESAVGERTRTLQKQLDAQAGELAERDARIAELEQKLAKRSSSAPAPVISDHKTMAILAGAFEDLAAGRVVDAQARFEQVLGSDPSQLEAKAGLAACYFEQNNGPAAWSVVNEILEIDDRNARALGIKGALLFRDGDLKAARKALERAIKYDEANPFFYNHLGVVMSALDRNESAIDNLKKAVSLDPNYAAAMYNLSILLASDERNPDLELARYYYEKALALGSPREPFMDQVLGRP